MEYWRNVCRCIILFYLLSLFDFRLFLLFWNLKLFFYWQTRIMWWNETVKVHKQLRGSSQEPLWRKKNHFKAWKIWQEGSSPISSEIILTSAGVKSIFFTLDSYFNNNKNFHCTRVFVNWTFFFANKTFSKRIS